MSSVSVSSACGGQKGAPAVTDSTKLLNNDNANNDNQQYCVTFQDVKKAAKRINGVAHQTPVFTCTTIDQLAATAATAKNNVSTDANTNQRRLFFKVEALQKTGSFKFRGAFNAIQAAVEEAAIEQIQQHQHQHQHQQEQQVINNATSTNSNNYNDDDDDDDDDHTRKGINLSVVTHSSGNHAQAVALAAQLSCKRVASNKDNNDDASQTLAVKVTATLCMPDNTPAVKRAAVQGYGGSIVLTASNNEAREEAANHIVQTTGATFIHPSENPRVIAGQGTVCLEMVQQVREIIMNQQHQRDLDLVIIPVGGGGLSAGNCITLRALLGNRVKIVLAEPKELDDASRSFYAGQLFGHLSDNQLASVADGLKTTLGPNTWPIIRDLADDILTVSEVDILRATKLIWERLKVCIEPSAGVGVAVALYSNEFAVKYPADRYPNVGIVLCGGNVDVLRLTATMQLLGI